jgi:hypothetical protein
VLGQLTFADSDGRDQKARVLFVPIHLSASPPPPVNRVRYCFEIRKCTLVRRGGGETAVVVAVAATLGATACVGFAGKQPCGRHARSDGTLVEGAGSLAACPGLVGLG